MLTNPRSYVLFPSRQNEARSSLSKRSFDTKYKKLIYTNYMDESALLD